MGWQKLFGRGLTKFGLRGRAAKFEGDVVAKSSGEWGDNTCLRDRVAK